MFSPSSFEWKRDAVDGFYDKYSLLLGVIAAAYYPIIFGLQRLMRDHEPFDLGGSQSKSAINYIFW